MAITVLKKGTPPEERKCRGTCTNCKSECEWKAGDGVGHSDQRDGDFNTIQCPVCQHKIHGAYVQ